MWGLSALLGRASTVAFLAASSSSSLSSSSSAPKAMRSSVAYYYSTTSSLSATQYLLNYDYIPDVLEQRGPYRDGHLELAKKLIAEGTCLSGGPTGDVPMEVPTGALFIFTTADAAKTFVEQDPYVEAGIVTSHTIQEWNVVVEKE